ncbi:hypothetical protein EN784_01200 [bacterium M00.F.Ca.ET.141.01.1.1]|nr:hypothetical protein EN784_01200 [bacterium M00.F.Ca.ET.141.01.1.1]
MKGLKVYLVGIAALGAVIGLFVGLSQSPVVSGVLTSLFGLLGVAGSFYLPWAQATANGSDTRKTSAEAAQEAALTATDDAATAHEAAARKTLSVSAVLADADNRKTASETELAALKATVPPVPDDQLTAKEEEVKQADAQRTQAQSDLDAAIAAERTAAEVLADANARFARKDKHAKAAAQDVEKEAKARVSMTYVAAGASLTAFSLAIVLAGLYGMLIRTGSSWRDLVISNETAKPVEAIDGQAAVDAVLLDRILGGLKVGLGERAKIVHLAVTSCNDISDLDSAAKRTLTLLSQATSDNSVPVAESTKTLISFQEELQKPPVSDNADAQRNFGRAQAALRQSIADISKLWASPTFVSGHPDAAKALGEFQVAAARYVGCEDVDQVLNGLVAKLKDLKETPAAATVTAPLKGLESAPEASQ